jgi:predicted lysophospholipase L1 biosynthesis ABC-type transport system permease subunit
MANEKDKVERQIVLSLSKAIEISLKGLRIRFWRSIITTSGIILGIAFLMSIFSTSIVHRGLLEKGTPEIKMRLQSEGETAEFGAKQIWLVSLSLLVCVVGITNAMLMSVTERYREIGTMKCLGALDSFIRKLFLLESLFQGLFGSIIGVVFGALFVVIISLIKYGGQAISTFPFFLFLGYAALALIIGVIISIIGALFPASQAAKMVPAEAMRTEV